MSIKMKMVIEYVNKMTRVLDDKKLLDIEIRYSNKWITTIEMSLWSEDRSENLSYEKRVRLNVEKLMPQKWRSEYITWFINRQSQRVAGVSWMD